MTPSGEEGLHGRMVRSGLWVFALQVVERLFDITKMIVLARILSPDAFGLIGVAMLTMTALETVSQTGFQQALIQRKQQVNDYLDTAWTYMALRGVCLYAALFLLAPYAAGFFRNPSVTPLLRIIGITLLLGRSGGVGGITNIGVLFFHKELQFHKFFLFKLSGTLTDFAVAILVAVIYRSYWALACGFLAGNAVRLLASYLIHPYRPRLNFDLGKARELFRFGKWIFLTSILVFLFFHGDDIFVGKIFSLTALGFYQLAYRISNAPATEITHVVTQVTFPAYSKLQQNLPGFAQAYQKTLQLTTFITIPLSGLIFILSPEFCLLFLGEKWLPMVPAMQVLAGWGLIRSVGATTSPVFEGAGKPEISTYLQMIQLVIMAGCIYPLSVRYGILGTSLAVVIAALLTNLVSCHMVAKVIRVDLGALGKTVAVPLLATAVMVGTVALARKIGLLAAGNLPVFLLSAIFALLVYLGIIRLADGLFHYGMQSSVRKVYVHLFGKS